MAIKPKFGRTIFLLTEAAGHILIMPHPKVEIVKIKPKPMKARAVRRI